MFDILMTINSIMIGIVTFLCTLFPNWGNLQFLHLQQTNDSITGAKKIVAAIEEHDISALEDLMCKNIKDNVPDLQEEIGALMDAIDSDINEITWQTGMGSWHGSNGDGRKIIQVTIDIYIDTSEGTYFLGVTWETANNFATEEAGIRSIWLLDPGGNLLAKIRATEGVGDYHY